MPKGPREEKRSADMIGATAIVATIATGEKLEQVGRAKTNPRAQQPSLLASVA